MIEYRDAVAADGEALNRMARQSFVETFGDEYDARDLDPFLAHDYGPSGLLADLARSDIAFRVARDGAAIVGYAKVSMLTLPAPAAEAGAMELRQIYVLRSHLGTGIAQPLMDWAIAHARAAGAPALYLSVFEFNHRAKAFYTRYGFVEVGEFDFRVGSRVDRDRIWRLAL